MNQIQAKIYFDKLSGDILTITSEMQGCVEPTTKEQDMEIYPALQDKSIDEVDFIELEYGTLATTFTNIKSYSIDLESKQLKCIYFTQEELDALQNNATTEVTLDSRINSVNEYVSAQDADTITAFEEFIIQRELDQIMNGGV